jgi:hypothetical protein
MEFEFNIPTSHQDLLISEGNSYCVSRVFNTNEITDKLKGNSWNFQCFISIYRKLICALLQLQNLPSHISLYFIFLIILTRISL